MQKQERISILFKKKNMAVIGKKNNLKIVKELSFGMYLDGGEHGEILIPTRYIPKNCKVDDWIDVFLYLDSDDRLIATTETPYAMVDDFALLKVVSVNAVGAFLDWGLSKDLLVPFREQKQTMREGQWCMVKVYFDKNSKRIVASAKLDTFLDNLPPDYTEGQEVDLIICNQTDLGYKAIINNLHWGMLYKNEVFQPLERGQRIKGFIKRIREDEKIDLSMEKPGYGKVDDITEKILGYLRANNGFMPVTDKSSPEVIYQLLGISKKAYKMTVGNLYKKGYISLEDTGVRLIGEDGE
jgi:uncharacterized protein